MIPRGRLRESGGYGNTFFPSGFFRVRQPPVRTTFKTLCRHNLVATLQCLLHFPCHNHNPMLRAPGSSTPYGMEFYQGQRKHINARARRFIFMALKECLLYTQPTSPCMLACQRQKAASGDGNMISPDLVIESQSLQFAKETF